MRKRLVTVAAAVFAVALALGALPARADAQQAAYKIPYKFKAAGKNAAAGDYRFFVNGDGKLVLKQEASGKELVLEYVKKLEPVKGAAAEPRLVFDEAGDFAPSYTEYFTVYVLAEVWLSGQEGFLIHETKGAHKQDVVKGTKAGK